MHRVFLSLTVLVLLAAIGSAQDAAPPLRVLIVTGVDYKGHHWKKTAPAIRDVLEHEGLMEARIVEDHEFLATDVIFDYDVVFLHFKNYDPTERAESV